MESNPCFNLKQKPTTTTNIMNAKRFSISTPLSLYHAVLLCIERVELLVVLVVG